MSNDDPFSLGDFTPNVPTPQSPVPSAESGKLDQVLAAVQGMEQRLSDSDRRVEKVYQWIGNQEKAKRAQSAPPVQRAPAAAELPKVKAASRRKLASGSNLQPFLVVMVIALVLVVVYLFIERNKDPEDVANNAARERAISTMRLLSESMAEGLTTIAADLKAGKLNERAETGERLKEVVRLSLDTASEEPLKALDALQPWSADRAAERFEAAAAGYSDSAGRLR